MSDPRRGRRYRLLRAEFLAAADPVCRWCGREVSDALPMGSASKATVDHLVEVGRDRSLALDVSLWVVACHRCNSRRGARFGNASAPAVRPSRAW